MYDQQDTTQYPWDNLPSGMAPLRETRELSISDSIKRSEEFQELFPDVDFTGGVIKPTINLNFDLQERVDEGNQKKHNALMAGMLEHITDTTEAEKYFWETRGCLANYPEVLAQFEAIYLKNRPISVMVGHLHECLSMKRAADVETKGTKLDSEGIKGDK
ncbi:hypothetical protein EsH8_IX_000832 [Colletotrichum jinshuiense]